MIKTKKYEWNTHELHGITWKIMEDHLLLSRVAVGVAKPLAVGLFGRISVAATARTPGMARAGVLAVHLQLRLQGGDLGCQPRRKHRELGPDVWCAVALLDTCAGLGCGCLPGSHPVQDQQPLCFVIQQIA